MLQERYNDFGCWLRRRFPFRIQKISIDAGFTCPNRDGLFGHGGCTYCDNSTFSPAYCNRRKSVAEQMQMGKYFFSYKYPDMKYLAYFQAYTNTYSDLSTLRKLYEEALNVSDTVGIVIGTRPDCVADELLDYLEELNKRCFVMVEYGVETANNDTLRRINRGHSFECSVSAIERTKARGILTGAHIIIGLPGEDAQESLRQAPIISALPIDILKIHQLQIIRGTQLAAQYERKPFHIYELNEYVDVVIKYLELLRDNLIIERFVSQSPAEKVIAPRWGIKNNEFTHLLLARMKATNTYQGRLAKR